MLEYTYKFRIQFKYDGGIGWVYIFAFKESEAINMFYKHCRLKNPMVVDCKKISRYIDTDHVDIGTLTITQNDEVLGMYSGAPTTIDIPSGGGGEGTPIPPDVIEEIIEA